MLTILVLALLAHHAAADCTPCAACERVGRAGDVPKFVRHPSECGGRPVVDLGPATHVYDLTCCESHAYYHMFTDCFVPTLPTLRRAVQEGGQDKEARVAIVPDFLAAYYEVLLAPVAADPAGRGPTSSSAPAAGTAAAGGGSDGGRRPAHLGRVVHKYDAKTCYVTSGEVIADRGERYQPMTPDEAAVLRNLVHTGLRITQGRPGDSAMDDRPGSHPVLTIIQRHGTRSFSNLDDISAAFREAFPGWTVQIYHGNETAADMLATFAGSRVVVGWHGAGFVGTLFSDPDTVVLEYTTLAGPGERTLWRTNAILAKLQNLTWIQHAVDLDRLENGSAEAMAAISKASPGSDRNHVIKEMSDIRLTPAVLFNSIRQVQEDLAGQKCL